MVEHLIQKEKNKLNFFWRRTVMYKGIQNHYYVYIYHQPTMCDILLLFNFALFFV